MPLPDRVLVIVVETEGGRDPDNMPLLARQVDDGKIAPAFSSMQLATTFLARAQELGYFVKLDYIFPAEGQQLPKDFPDHQFVLNPTPETFFGEGSQGSHKLP
jgi:hypothetical protein